MNMPAIGAGGGSENRLRRAQRDERHQQRVGAAVQDEADGLAARKRAH